MSDTLISLVPAVSLQPANQTPAFPLPAASGQQDAFKQLLSTMLLAGSAGSSSGGGMAGMDLLAPLMLILMEQLLAKSVEPAEQPKPAAVPAQVSQVIFPTGLDEPAGRPVEGRLTQKYHPSHNGLDFGIPVGTPIRTTMDGKVVYAGWNNQGYGNLVIVENGPYRTYYAHLSSVPVQVGQTVGAGSVIGLSGNTGNSTGPHLHYEIRYNMKAIDPTQRTLHTPALWST